MHAAAHLLLRRAWSESDCPMKHKGVEYTIVASTMPDVWNYEFRIGEKVKSGKTETRISSLAIRRVALRIDRALKDATQKQGP